MALDPSYKTLLGEGDEVFASITQEQAAEAACKEPKALSSFAMNSLR